MGIIKPLGASCDSGVSAHPDGVVPLRQMSTLQSPHSPSNSRRHSDQQSHAAVLPWMSCLVQWHEMQSEGALRTSGTSLDGSSSFPRSLADLNGEPLLDQLELMLEDYFEVEALDVLTKTQTLVCLGMHCCFKYKLVESLQLDVNALRNFLLRVQHGYKDVSDCWRCILPLTLPRVGIMTFPYYHCHPLASPAIE